MKKLLFFLALLFSFTARAQAVELLVYVGDQYLKDDSRFDMGFRDGQIISVRPDGYYASRDVPGIYKRHAVIVLPIKYKDFLGSDPMALNKLTSRTDSSGRFKWDVGYDDDAPYIHRKHFIDFKDMMNKALFGNATFESIYKKERTAEISISTVLPNILKEEGKDSRLDHKYRPTELRSLRDEAFRQVGLFLMPVALGAPGDCGEGPTTGTCSVGTSGDYSDMDDAVADIGGTLTGNLTFELKNEESTWSTDHPITEDLAGYTLRFTAESGAEHNGGAYGNGARITTGAEYREFFNTAGMGNSVTGTVEIDHLGLQTSNTSCYAASPRDGDSITYKLHHCVLDGDGLANPGIFFYSTTMTTYIYNNVFYDFPDNLYPAIGNNGQYGAYGITAYIYNNTIIDCTWGIGCSHANCYGTYYVKNNLIQDSATASFLNLPGNSGTYTTAKNITEDANGPDPAYDNTDVHTNTVFMDYANGDFRLHADGDATNLAIVDDGDDLSGTFTTDIVDQTRSTWYIGASVFSSCTTCSWGSGDSSQFLQGTAPNADYSNYNGSTQWGASFTTTAAICSTGVKVYIRDTGSDTGSARVCLYTSDGGSPAKPVGVVQGACDTVAMSSVSDSPSYEWQEFTWTGVNLEASTKYFVVPERRDSAAFNWGYDTDSSVNWAMYSAGWTGYSSAVQHFYDVYGCTEGGGPSYIPREHVILMGP